MLGTIARRTLEGLLENLIMTRSIESYVMSGGLAERRLAETLVENLVPDGGYAYAHAVAILNGIYMLMKITSVQIERLRNSAYELKIWTSSLVMDC
jgi:hypothetical protein